MIRQSQDIAAILGRSCEIAVFIEGIHFPESQSAPPRRNLDRFLQPTRITKSQKNVSKNVRPTIELIMTSMILMGDGSIIFLL